MPSIDQRIVEMQFDNKDFESGIQTSIKSLDNLKQSLDFKGASSGLSELESFGKGLDFSGLSGAVDSISEKFSALGIIGVTALQNITNQAVDAGVALVKSLSTDQISAGWDKYADKTSAVQTIMAATAKEFEEAQWEDVGSQMEYVNEQLEKLNWFTDETSYNFLEMVNNIGKFTNNNIALDDAVTSMMGISTWAALAGANSQEASRAMYNLSQAISVGAVKLQDWKSIENANMATAEFKETVIQTAIELGKIKPGDVDVASFSATLKNNWFDSEVLTETLAKYGKFTDNLYEASWLFEDQYATVNQLLGALDEYKAGTLDVAEVAKNTGRSVEMVTTYFDILSDSTMALGEKGFRAAQEAKTFKEAIDSVKDAVSTGWMNTFELIFGDYEEAKRLWTDFANFLYEIFAESGNARNDLIADWKELGGRDALFEGITNAWEALASVIDPIKEAFRDIFPPMTAERLVAITEAFRDFTSNLKISAETSEKVKRIFSGVFSAFDIVRQVVVALASGLGRLLGIIAPVGDGFLSFIAGIGDFVTNLNSSIKETALFGTAVNSIIDFIQPAIDIFNSFKEAVKGAVTYISEKGTEGFSNFAQSISNSFHPLTSMASLVKKVFSSIISFIAALLPKFSSFSKSVGEVFSSIKDAILNALDVGDFSGVIALLDMGLIGALIAGVKKFFSTLTELTESGKGILDGIKGILDGVRGSLEAWQQNIKAGAILKIAGALAVLAAALLVISKIEKEQLVSSLTTITILFAELFGSMAAFDKVVVGGTKKMTSLSIGMIGISAAILILSSALTKLQDLSWDDIVKGLLSVATLMLALTLSASEMTKHSGKLISTGLGLIAFAGAITILVSAVGKLGSLDTEDLFKGLLSVGVLCAELALFLKGADFNKLSLTKAVGIFALAQALSILSQAVSTIGSLDISALMYGLGAIALLLVEIGFFMQSLNDTSGMLSKSLGMLVLAGALVILGQAVEKIGGMAFWDIVQSITAIAGSLNSIPKDIASKASGLLIASVGLKVLSSALATMGNMGIGEIFASLAELAGALFIMSTAMKAMQGSVSGAAAMLVMAGALAILAPALKLLGSMSLSDVVLSLLELAGVFAVFGVAATVLAPLVPVLLGLAGAIALLGIGVAATGAGLLAFSAGLSALAVAGTAGVSALVVAITALIGLLPTFFTGIGKGIVALVTAIADSAEAIIEAVAKILVALGEGIIKATPTVVEAIVTVITEILRALADSVPEMVDSGMRILTGVLKGITDHIQEATETAIQLAINFIEGISSKLPDLIQAGYDLVIAFLEGLADAIRNNMPIVLAAIADVGSAIIEGLAKGILGGVGTVVNAIKNVATSAIEGAKKLFDINSPSKVFEWMGLQDDQGLAIGLEKGIPWVNNAMTDVATSGLSAFTKNNVGFESAGQDAIQALLNGMDLDNFEEPVITPVLDLSNLQDANGQIGSLLNSGASIGVSADSLSMLQSLSSDFNQNGSDSQKEEFDDSDILRSIDNLGARIDTLQSAIASMKVVMDSGALVGQIETRIDQRLGVLAGYKGRGM